MRTRTSWASRPRTSARRSAGLSSSTAVRRRRRWPTGRRAQPGRATRVRRHRASCPPVPDGSAAVLAALRIGEHRVHDRRREWSTCRASGTSVHESPGEFLLAILPPRRSWRSASSRAFFSRSASRSCDTSATAIGRIRWCSFQTRRAMGASAGRAGFADRAGTDRLPYGADLFYANADHFADEVRELVEKAPAPVRWFVLDASAMTDLDYSAARTVRDLLGELSARNVCVVFGRVNAYLRADLDRHGISAERWRSADLCDAPRGDRRGARRRVSG